MRFKKGDKVEVLSQKEVSSSSWHCAEIICGNGHNYTVRYDGYTSASGNTVERVSRKAIRPCPPPLTVLEPWVPGNVVEVFDNFSWKMATISKVSGRSYFLVRLLGSSLDLKIQKCNIRLRQSWEDDSWVVIGEGSRCCEDGKQDKDLILKNCQKSRIQVEKTTNKRINLHVTEDCFLVKSKGKIQESHIASSRTLKRGSSYCYSQGEECSGAAKKIRAIERVGRLHRLIAINPSSLPDQVDSVALPIEFLGEAYMHPSNNNGTARSSEVEAERRKPISAVGCSVAVNLESNDGHSVTCSVGSCSISSNDSYKLPHHVSAARADDTDGNFSDAESYCHLGYEEGNFLLPTKEELADEIHRLELHAYRCTMEALHASGPLSWELEALVTNLRLSLHISNDEHLMEIRNLISAR